MIAAKVCALRGGANGKRPRRFLTFSEKSHYHKAIALCRAEIRMLLRQGREKQRIAVRCHAEYSLAGCELVTTHMTWF